MGPGTPPFLVTPAADSPLPSTALYFSPLLHKCITASAVPGCPHSVYYVCPSTLLCPWHPPR